MTQHDEDEVELEVDDLTERQILVTLLKRLVALENKQNTHNAWMENFMSELSPEFTDLTNAVTAVVAAIGVGDATMATQLAQITDLTTQVATITAQDTTDAASAAAALAQVADLNAQIAALTASVTAQATAAETAATSLTAALPAVVTPPATA